MNVYAVVGVMVSGAKVDILMFLTAGDAEQHACYIRTHCALLGFDRILVEPRRVIGRMLDMERRKKPRRKIVGAYKRVQRALAASILAAATVGCGDKNPTAPTPPPAPSNAVDPYVPIAVEKTGDCEKSPTHCQPRFGR